MGVINWVADSNLGTEKPTYKTIWTFAEGTSDLQDQSSGCIKYLLINIQPWIEGADCRNSTWILFSRVNLQQCKEIFKVKVHPYVSVQLQKTRRSYYEESNSAQIKGSEDIGKKRVENLFFSPWFTFIYFA